MRAKIIVGLIVVVLAVGLFFWWSSGRVRVVPGARTLYEGYVEIERVSLPEVIQKLEAFGCSNSYRPQSGNPCMYQEKKETPLGVPGIEIFPNGPGFGPLSFYVTTDKLWAYKDIPDLPDKEKYKDAVRKDTERFRDIFSIKETTWNVTKMEYPWMVVY